ncbi:MAG: hypothetical protein HY046_07725 [Acidobacteria bacterium]|nr:hypothetical protein [Acidobacteriota bacterium]
MPDTTKHGHNAGGHEKTDADIRLLAGFSFSVMGLMISSLLLMGLLYFFLNSRFMRSEPAPLPLAGTLAKEPPAPRLQLNQKIDLATLHEEERVSLESYGWMDKNLGIVHIPIERAMELTLERGLPTGSSSSKAEEKK